MHLCFRDLEIDIWHGCASYQYKPNPKLPFLKKKHITFVREGRLAENPENMVKCIWNLEKGNKNQCRCCTSIIIALS